MCSHSHHLEQPSVKDLSCSNHTGFVNQRPAHLTAFNLVGALLHHKCTRDTKQMPKLFQTFILIAVSEISHRKPIRILKKEAYTNVWSYITLNNMINQRLLNSNNRHNYIWLKGMGLVFCTVCMRFNIRYVTCRYTKLITDKKKTVPPSAMLGTYFHINSTNQQPNRSFIWMLLNQPTRTVMVFIRYLKDRKIGMSKWDTTLYKKKKRTAEI